MAAMPGCALDGARRIPSRVMAIIRSRSSSEPSRRNARSASRRTKRDARSTMALLAKNRILTPDAEQNASCHNCRTVRPNRPGRFDRGVPPGRVRRSGGASPHQFALLAPPVDHQPRPFFLDCRVFVGVTPDRAQNVRHDMHHLLPRIVEVWFCNAPGGQPLAPIIPIDKQLETALLAGRVPDQRRQVSVRPDPIDPLITVTQFSESAINLGGDVICHGLGSLRCGGCGRGPAAARRGQPAGAFPRVLLQVIFAIPAMPVGSH